MGDHERCKHVAQEAIAEEEVECSLQEVDVEDAEARSAYGVVVPE